MGGLTRPLPTPLAYAYAEYNAPPLFAKGSQDVAVRFRASSNAKKHWPDAALLAGAAVHGVGMALGGFPIGCFGNTAAHGGAAVGLSIAAAALGAALG